MKKIICLYFLFSSIASYALPFNIAPKSGTQLPGIVYTSTVLAYYTVSNNTQSQRNDNFIKYLPPNVVQVTSGGTYPDTCGTTFNLAPAGQAGSSCTLQLSISGPINGNDPDPHHHLFVCMPGGKSCAGTNYPLNVSQPSLVSIAVSPKDATINALSSLLYTAIGTYANGMTQDISTDVSWDSTSAIASFNNSNIAIGVTSGVTTITAKLGAISDSTTLKVKAYAYIANTVANQVLYCPISLTNNGTFDSCTSTGGTFTNPYVIAINPSGTFVYVGAQSSHRVIYCAVESDGSLNDTCHTATSGSDKATGIAFNSNGTIIYITHDDKIDYCTVHDDGSITSCTDTGATVPSAYGITLNPTGTFAYATSNSTGKIYYCPVHSDGSLGTCNNSSSIVSSPVALAFNYAGNYLYVTNQGSNVTYCNINNNGSIGTCSTISGVSNLNNLQGIMFNGASTYVYLVDGDPTNTVSFCTINFDGTFNTCSTTGSGISNAFGIAVS